MKILDMTKSERPRERFARAPSQASMSDLVAILLRTGYEGCSVVELAQKVTQRLGEGDERWYMDLHWRDLTDIHGIGKDKAVTICAAIELGRRLKELHDKEVRPLMNSPERVAGHFMERLRYENQEHFCVGYLNTKMQLIGEREIGIGSLQLVPVDIKEALKWAIRYNACALVLVHNHPSGDPEPSEEDVDITKRFKEAAQLLDMDVVDHVVIGNGTFTSFQVRGFL